MSPKKSWLPPPSLFPEKQLKVQSEDFGGLSGWIIQLIRLLNWNGKQLMIAVLMFSCSKPGNGRQDIGKGGDFPCVFS